MVKEWEFPIPGGSLYYEKIESEQTGAGICITRMQGLAGEVEIPARIEGMPVVAIGRKAFLSKKNLRKVSVPETVTEVGDWAFAYCDHLHTVRFGQEGEKLRFGKAVFLECGGLRFVCVKDGSESTAALLAAAVTTAEAPYLLDAQEAGSREWLEKWDARMFAVLHSADEEGYSRQVLCGEEDYGSTDKVAYESGRRKVKVRLLLLRCLYPEGLAPERRSEMEAYLRATDETWQVILKEHGEDQAYYKLFTDLGCVTKDNFDSLLRDVGGDCPELRAYLMRYKEEKLGYSDFFADLGI